VEYGEGVEGGSNVGIGRDGVVGDYQSGHHR